MSRQYRPVQFDFSRDLVSQVGRGSVAAERAVLDELRATARVDMEGLTPGQRAHRRALRAADVPAMMRAKRLTIDAKARTMTMQEVAPNGQVLTERRSKARRHTRLHLLSGHVDLVEPREFVMAAMQNAETARTGVARLHEIGGHGQITQTDIPQSAVVRVEALR